MSLHPAFLHSGQLHAPREHEVLYGGGHSAGGAIGLHSGVGILDLLTEGARESYFFPASLYVFPFKGSLGTSSFNFKCVMASPSSSSEELSSEFSPPLLDPALEASLTCFSKTFLTVLWLESSGVPLALAPPSVVLPS